MPTVGWEALERFVAAILVGAGAPDAEAATVARLSVAANLARHDSHGVTLIPGYVAQIASGAIRPGAPTEIVRETPTVTVVDGNGGFGYVVAERAMDITMRKAEAVGMAVTTVRRQSHVGRLAAYPIRAARAGLISVMMASGSAAKYVVPFGGAEARLGTNPISIAVPSALDGVFAFDMATSNVAGGKVRLAATRGQEIPAGWIVDGSGLASTDPQDLARGGALLPLGGDVGHKGYALSATIEVLARILPALGGDAEDGPVWGNSCFMACFAVSAFGDPSAFGREVAEFAEYLTSTRPADGFAEVTYPGERSARREVERRRDGIPLPEAVWGGLLSVAADLGVPVSVVPAVFGDDGAARDLRDW